MKTRMFKGTCLATVAMLLASASVGTVRAQFPYVPSLPFGGGHDTARHLVRAAVVASVIYFVAKHQADERQRQLAEQRGRQSYARMSAKRKADMKARKVRYIAVDTHRGAKSSPKAKKTVMIYDTQAQRVASNNAYDVAQTPAVGSTAKIDSYSAEYVGSGL
jgi:hypothetical protein